MRGLLLAEGFFDLLFMHALRLLYIRVAGSSMIRTYSQLVFSRKRDGNYQ